MAGQVLTIYNSGTAYDERSPDLIPVLARTTRGKRGVDWEINPGPGSWQQARRDSAISGLAPGQAVGQALGIGIKETIAISLELIERTAPAKVNFCGWSRGAITCMMTASALAKTRPALPVNMFLFDPVIGDSVVNAALWKGDATDVLGPNVRAVSVIQMLDERRFYMQAHLPPALTAGARPGLTLLPLPGEHASAVEPSAGPYAKVFDLGLGLAKGFLDGHGTRFSSFNPLSDVKFLELYSSLWRALHGTPTVPLMNNRYELLEQQRRQVPTDRSFSIPNLFFNTHHVRMMNSLFPICSRLIAYALMRRGRASGKAIADARSEFARAVRGDIPESLSVIGYYLSHISPE